MEGICEAEKKAWNIGNSEIDLKCDLYADHGGRHRTVINNDITIFWE